MISKIITLTKVFLKNSYQLNYNKENKTKPKNKTFRIIVYILLIAYLMGVFGFLSYQIINTLNSINQPAVFIGLFLLVSAVLVLFQTILSSVNVFYFAKDIEFVLPMPIKPVELLIAKFNTILITEYVSEFIFLLAPIIVYGILTAAGAMFYVYAFLILIIFPILPALIACFIIMVIMSFSNITKNKDKFQLITTILAIAVALGIQFCFYGNGSEITDEQMLEKIMQANGLVDTISKYFITIQPSIDTLLNYNNIWGLINLGKVLGITVISYIIFVGVGTKIYLKGAVGNFAGGGKKKKFDKTKAYIKRKIQDTYVLKEMKILFRNPIFFTQCVLPVAIMPIIMFVATFTGVNSNGDFNLSTIITQNLNPLVLGIALIAIQFLQMMSYIAITAVSRDGKNAQFIKYIPIPLYKQFIYKIIPAILINTIPIVFVSGLLLVIAPNLWLYAIAIFLLATIMNILQSYVMLIVDLKRPKLEWDTELAVVKQNMNIIFEIGYCFIAMGIIVGLAFLVINFNNLIFIFSLLVVLLISTICVDRYVHKNQEKLFAKIY